MHYFFAYVLPHWERGEWETPKCFSTFWRLPPEYCLQTSYHQFQSSEVLIKKEKKRGTDFSKEAILNWIIRHFTICLPQSYILGPILGQLLDVFPLLKDEFQVHFLLILFLYICLPLVNFSHFLGTRCTIGCHGQVQGLSRKWVEKKQLKFEGKLWRPSEKLLIEITFWRIQESVACWKQSV